MSSSSLVLKTLPIDSIVLDEELALRGSQEEVTKNKSAFLQLVESVRKHGILQPPLGRFGYDDAGNLQEDIIILVDGRQRYAAAKRAGLTTFPVAVDPNIKSFSDIVLAQTTTNLDRINTDPSQVRDHLMRLTKYQPDLSLRELAEMFNRSVPWVQNILKLKNVSELVQAALDENEINVTAAQIVAELPTKLQDEWLGKFLEHPSPSDQAETLLNLREFIKERKKTGKEPVDFSSVPRPRTATALREMYEHLERTDKTDPRWAGLQWAVQLDPETVQARKDEVENKELHKKIAQDEKKLREAKAAEDRLAENKRKLEEARAKEKAENPTDLTD